MDELRRFIIVMFGAATMIGLSILVMIYGWGLAPKSWWWIIGVGLIARAVTHIFFLIATNKED